MQDPFEMGIDEKVVWLEAWRKINFACAPVEEKFKSWHFGPEHCGSFVSCLSYTTPKLKSRSSLEKQMQKLFLDVAKTKTADDLDIVESRSFQCSNSNPFMVYQDNVVGSTMVWHGLCRNGSDDKESKEKSKSDHSYNREFAIASSNNECFDQWACSIYVEWVGRAIAWDHGPLISKIIQDLASVHWNRVARYSKYGYHHKMKPFVCADLVLYFAKREDFARAEYVLGLFVNTRKTGLYHLMSAVLQNLVENVALYASGTSSKAEAFFTFLVRVFGATTVMWQCRGWDSILPAYYEQQRRNLIETTVQALVHGCRMTALPWAMTLAVLDRNTGLCFTKSYFMRSNGTSKNRTQQYHHRIPPIDKIEKHIRAQCGGTVQKSQPFRDNCEWCIHLVRKIHSDILETSKRTSIRKLENRLCDIWDDICGVLVKRRHRGLVLKRVQQDILSELFPNFPVLKLFSMANEKSK